VKKIDFFRLYKISSLIQGFFLNERFLNYLFLFKSYKLLFKMFFHIFHISRVTVKVGQCSEINAHFVLISEVQSTILSLPLDGRTADHSRDAVPQKHHDIRNMLEPYLSANYH